MGRLGWEKPKTMKETTFTLKQLSDIYRLKNYLPADRFIYYFMHWYNYTEADAKKAFRLFVEFPKLVYTHTNQPELDKTLLLAAQLLEKLEILWNNRPENIRYTYDYEMKKLTHKLIYTENDEIKELVLHLHKAEDVVTYAELLKKDIKQLALLDYCCSISKHNDKDVLIFEGDFFNTNDKYYGIDSNIYVAEKNETFKKLLYIKGKGYLLNKALNYDSGSFNYHALTLKDWNKIGNIYIPSDLVKLTEDIPSLLSL